MAVHFVGFNPSDTRRWASAVAVWGEPDYIHPLWDYKAYGEYDPQADTVVFAGNQTRLLPRRGATTTITIPNVYYSSKR